MLSLAGNDGGNDWVFKSIVGIKSRSYGSTYTNNSCVGP